MLKSRHDDGAGAERLTAEATSRSGPGTGSPRHTGSDRAEADERTGDGAVDPEIAPQGEPRTTPQVRLASGLRLPRIRPRIILIGAVPLAALDLLVANPAKNAPYSYLLGAIACLALLARNRFPFSVMLATIPGWMLGPTEIAVMVALGTVANRYRWRWQTIVAAAGVWCGRVLIWPPSAFLAETWRQHAGDAIYGVIVAGLPITIALVASAHRQLAVRVAELSASREREQALAAQAVRAEERARLAREMHDVVSHQVALIAMQAGAMQVAGPDTDPRQAARTIRSLCIRTLDELRSLVGMMRTTADPAGAGRIGLAALAELAGQSQVRIRIAQSLLEAELPVAVSAAVYRTVQEALTNAHKYAPGAPAEVSISTDRGQLWVEIRNGRPLAGPRSMLPSGGYGLLGLRERAAILGGTLQASPTRSGGFLVRATFPLPNDHRAHRTAGGSSHLRKV